MRSRCRIALLAAFRIAAVQAWIDEPPKCQIYFIDDFNWPGHTEETFTHDRCKLTAVRQFSQGDFPYNDQMDFGMIPNWEHWMAIGNYPDQEPPPLRKEEPYELYELGFNCQPRLKKETKTSISFVQRFVGRALNHTCDVHLPYDSNNFMFETVRPNSPWEKDTLGNATDRIVFPCKVSARKEVHEHLNTWRSAPFEFNATALPQYRKHINYRYSNYSADMPRLTSSRSGDKGGGDNYPPPFHKVFGFGHWNPYSMNKSPFMWEMLQDEGMYGGERYGTKHIIRYNRPYHTGRFYFALRKYLNYEIADTECVHAGQNGYRPVPGYEFAECYLATNGTVDGRRDRRLAGGFEFAKTKMKFVDDSRYLFEEYHSPDDTYHALRMELNPNFDPVKAEEEVNFDA